MIALRGRGGTRHGLQAVHVHDIQHGELELEGSGMRKGKGNGEAEVAGPRQKRMAKGGARYNIHYTLTDHKTPARTRGEGRVEEN